MMTRNYLPFQKKQFIDTLAFSISDKQTGHNDKCSFDVLVDYVIF